MAQKLMKLAVGFSISFLLCIGVLYFTDASYPDTRFAFLLPLSLIFLVLALLLLISAWILHIKQAYQQKNRLDLFLWVTVGIVCILITYIKHFLA